MPGADPAAFTESSPAARLRGAPDSLLSTVCPGYGFEGVDRRGSTVGSAREQTALTAPEVPTRHSRRDPAPAERVSSTAVLSQPDPRRAVPLLAPSAERSQP